MNGQKIGYYDISNLKSKLLKTEENYTKESEYFGGILVTEQDKKNKNPLKV